MQQLHVSHGLNLNPQKMIQLAQALGTTPVLHALSDHQEKRLHQSENEKWQKWMTEVENWVINFDQTTNLLAYSISAPLIMNALNEKNIEINKLILIAPAFFPRFKNISRKLLKFIPFNFPVPSFNNKSDRCNSWIPADLYREVFENLERPERLPTKKCILLIHRFDEILDSKKTIAWGKQVGCEIHELKSPVYPPFHATYQPQRLPIKIIKDYLNSSI